MMGLFIFLKPHVKYCSQCCQKFLDKNPKILLKITRTFLAFLGALGSV